MVKWKTLAIVMSVVAGLAIVSLGIMLGLIYTNGSEMQTRFKVSADNDRIRVGEMLPNDDIGVPTLGSKGKYDGQVAKFSADLVSRLALARTKSLKLVAPPGLKEVARLHSVPGDKLGWVLVDDPSHPTVAFVVFRGTASKREWEKDFELQQIPYAVSLTNNRIGELPIPKLCESPMASCSMFDQGVQVHKGFLDMYGDLRGQLVRALSPYLHVPIVVTGHSLGAALAALCCLDLRSNAQASDVRMYTFAPPRAGNPEFAEAFNGLISEAYQIVNFTDLVPAVPLAVMPNNKNPSEPWLFQHVGKILHFSDNWGSWRNNHTMPIYMHNLDKVEF